MGLEISRMGSNGRRNTALPLPVHQNNSSFPYIEELRTYEADSNRDPQLQEFNNYIQRTTNCVISRIADGVEVQAFSFDSLKEVISCLLQMNQNVVSIICRFKEDIWESKGLFEIVQEYLNNSLKTLEFVHKVENCLKNARNSQIILQIALKKFEEEDEADENRCYAKTLEELKNFQESEDPFDEKFFHLFHEIRNQHIATLEKLVLRKEKLDKKLKKTRVWRKVLNVIFGTLFAAVLICSVVTAAIAVPNIAPALAAASSIPIGSVGKWFDSMWKSYEEAAKWQGDLIDSMRVGTIFGVREMDTIKSLVDRLKLNIMSMSNVVNLSLQEDGVIKFGVEEIKRELKVFMENIDFLIEEADKCSDDIKKARVVVLERIITPPR